MARGRVPRSSVGARWFIVALGAVYIAIAAGRWLFLLDADRPVTSILVVTVFIGIPGLVLLVGGLRLPRTAIRPELYRTVATWCLVGFAGMLALLAIYHVTVDPIDEPDRSLPILTALASSAGFAIGIHNAKEQTRTHQLAGRSRQQRVVADLGQTALETDDIDELISEATVQVADVLDAAYCTVLDLDDEAEELRLRAGVGWDDGIVGQATVSAVASDSQAAHTLARDYPIVVDDLETETRFSGPDLLRRHDVNSGISTIIGPFDAPWGILGVHDTDRRAFTDEDVTFVQSVANVLAEAIEEDRTKRKLREQESELETTFNRITDGFLGLDADWTITYANEHGREILDPAGEGLVGRNFWEVFEPALGTTFETEYREVMATQEPTSFEEYYPPLDVWFEVNAYPTRSGLSIYFRDVTGRKGREQELTRFKRAVESSGHAIYMTDVDGVIRYVNPAFEETTGYAASEAIGEFPSILQSGEHDDAYYETLWETIDSGDVWEEVIIDRHKDGELYYAEQTIAPVTDERGEIDRYVAVQNDITERIERERELAESERRYRTLAEHFPNGIVTLLDQEFTYTLAAGLAFDYLPVDPDDVEGLTPAEAWGEDSADELEPVIRAALDGERRTIEVSYVDRDWRVYAVPVTDERDTVYAAMVMALDVTEEKDRQRALETSNERLEQFAYAASHDMQEPLRMVSSYLQLLERRYEDDLDEEATEFIEFAVDGADRMRSMIEGLLRYSRVETRGDPLQAVDLDAVLEAVHDDLRVAIDSSDATITSDDLPRVEGDPHQLRQVFQNVLENAITYSGDAPPDVHVSATSNGSDWIVSIEDAGIGIDPADQERIFEVFQRAHDRREGDGTGIGLALCERIIERHGGDIWVDSTPGEGSTFSFSVPAADG